LNSEAQSLRELRIIVYLVTCVESEYQVPYRIGEVRYCQNMAAAVEYKLGAVAVLHLTRIAP